VKIEVRFQERILDDMHRWAAQLPGEPSDRELFLSLYIEDIIEHLTEFVGIPKHAVRVEGWHPPLYWWQYSDDLWIEYTVRTRGGWFFNRTVKITVLRLQTQPPERTSP